ncbi:cytosine deaminase [Leptolyngbya sp. Heron Island J]|uniref:cytosine deaminase n=1 Tax=Leptolyngbya sp. Heron Island J TaxID=1385935 RepID=UPI0003B96C9F|nr:cytosine deaminase [Leptolyngbya sp. Heron Island J]ESA39155.1 cytosine deaminase [Leptolyngbya sp. Heron Island J]
MAGFISIPDVAHYWLTNGRVPLCFLAESVGLEPIAALQAFPHQEELVAVDIEVQAGAIARILPAGQAAVAACPAVNLNQGLIWPCFVDMHTHLDKGHTWPRCPNPDGTFIGALETVRQDHSNWQPDDLYQRMEFGLKCSYAHGTQAIRTHLDSFGPLGATNFTVFDHLRRQWQDRLTLQAVCLVSLDYFLTPEGESLAQLVAEFGGILGGVAYMNEDIVAQLDRVFMLAKRYGLDLDFHTDESLNPDDITLRYVAEAALRHDFQGAITCGHCCSLSVQSAETVEKTLSLVKAANIGIVSLPMCNLYLQDRQRNRTPRYRGVTILHEIHHQGIRVALSSDNCRDPFYAYGDHDGLDVFKQSVRIGHLDRPFDHWPLSLTSRPAELMGLTGVGTLVPGSSANLICFKARSLNELVARAQCDRVVLRQGQSIDTTLPDYSELDAWVF